MVRVSGRGLEHEGSDLGHTDSAELLRRLRVNVLVVLLAAEDASTAAILDKVPLVASAASILIG